MSNETTISEQAAIDAGVPNLPIYFDSLLDGLRANRIPGHEAWCEYVETALRILAHQSGIRNLHFGERND